MKRTIYILLISLLVFSLCSCGDSKQRYDEGQYTYEQEKEIREHFESQLTTYGYDYSIHASENDGVIEFSVYLTRTSDGAEETFVDTIEWANSAAKATSEKYAISEKELRVSFILQNPDGALTYTSTDLSTGKLISTIDSNPAYEENILLGDVRELLCGKAVVVPEELLSPFQGQWADDDGEIRYIISGGEVNSIHYDTFNKDVVSKIYTFYFELDESENLVVCNQYSQPCFTLRIDENGNLIEEDIPADEKTYTYTKASDSTDLPMIAKDPEIGMTKSEVYSSTWGYPSKVNTTETASGTREQWVYNGRNGYEGYLYFENGILVSIQKR